MRASYIESWEQLKEEIEELPVGTKFKGLDPEDGNHECILTVTDKSDNSIELTIKDSYHDEDIVVTADEIDNDEGWQEWVWAFDWINISPLR